VLCLCVFQKSQAEEVTFESLKRALGQSECVTYKLIQICHAIVQGCLITWKTWRKSWEIEKWLQKITKENQLEVGEICVMNLCDCSNFLDKFHFIFIAVLL